jgi:hypothetical protein
MCMVSGASGCGPRYQRAAAVGYAGQRSDGLGFLLPQSSSVEGWILLRSPGYGCAMKKDDRQAAARRISTARLAAAMAWNATKAAEYGYVGPKPRANARPVQPVAARVGSLRRLPKVWAP